MPTPKTHTETNFGDILCPLGTTFSVSTYGTSWDTELGLYSQAGALVVSQAGRNLVNDDAYRKTIVSQQAHEQGGGHRIGVEDIGQPDMKSSSESLLFLTEISVGVYYIAVGRYDTTFNDIFSSPSSPFGVTSTTKSGVDPGLQLVLNILVGGVTLHTTTVNPSTLNNDDGIVWFEINIITSATGGTADPYITTLNGITYKMADFTGFSRMIQGTLENKPFTLNTETTLLNKEELTDLAIHRNKLFSEEIIEGYKVDEFPAYFSKLHVSWGEDSVTIDLKTFEVIHSTTNEEYETKSSMGKQYNWSTKETKEEKMFIPFGPVTLVVKNIPNVDVRNGFTILGSNHITDKVGALVKPMYVKDIKLKSLTSTKFIKDVKDRTPKKTIKQVFRTKGGEIIEKDMPIY